MKKFLIPFIALFVAVFFYGCTPRPEFDNLEILKIESAWTEGFAPFPREFVRTFDFKTGRIIDTITADEKDIPAEEADRYNTPTAVAAFDEAQAQELIATVKSLGFYGWEDRYVTTDAICDGGSQTVTVHFADGTVKSTYIYFEYPPNYEKICSSFVDCLGAKLYYE